MGNVVALTQRSYSTSALSGTVSFVRFFDAGQHANGIIALGQEATGVIAIGQVATGVVAIGQLARGGIAIGQAAFGIWSIGMAAGGLYKAHGMIGVAGNRGIGGILPLLPSLGRRHQVPKATPFREVYEKPHDTWIRATLKREPSGDIGIYEGETLLPVKLHANLTKAARDHVANPSANKTLFVHITPVSQILVADRLLAEPLPQLKKPFFWPLTLVQVSAFFGLTMAYWHLVATPAIDAIFRVINDAPVVAPTPKATPAKKAMPKMY